MFLSRGHGISLLEEAILLRLLSAHGLLQILMFYDLDVLLLNFLLGCYWILVMNSSLLIYLFTDFKES